jgi:hypothetical protein
MLRPIAKGLRGIESPSTTAPDAEALRSELAEALARADSETLKRALNLIRKKC